MTQFLSAVINGGLTGVVYALVAMGFVVIYRSSQVFNFAQGEFLALGGYLVITVINNTDAPLAVAVPGALLLAAVVGVVVQRLLFKRMVGQSPFSTVMVTVGLLVLLQGLMMMIWGPLNRPFPALVPNRVVRLGDIAISRSLLAGAVVTVVAAIGLSLFFNRTRSGLKMSAVAEDHTTAMSMGISVHRTAYFAWMVGAVLSVVGALAVFNSKSIAPGSSALGLAALPIALLAGIESISGLVPAGLIIGIATGLSAAYLDHHLTGTSTALPYVVMLVVMFARPQGLYGWKHVERI